jgi:hypothetical protein
MCMRHDSTNYFNVLAPGWIWILDTNLTNPRALAPRYQEQRLGWRKFADQGRRPGLLCASSDRAPRVSSLRVIAAPRLGEKVFGLRHSRV